jgi:hypothetical protein
MQQNHLQGGEKVRTQHAAISIPILIILIILAPALVLLLVPVSLLFALEWFNAV